MGIEPDNRFERQARQQAAERGWTFEKLQRRHGADQQLVNGPWDDAAFLVVPPGSRIAASFRRGNREGGVTPLIAKTRRSRKGEMRTNPIARSWANSHHIIPRFSRFRSFALARLSR